MIKRNITGRRGSSFVLAMTFILVSLWALAEFESHLRAGIAAHEKESALFSSGLIQNGLAKGVSLLETGAPVNNYTCKPNDMPVTLVFKKVSDVDDGYWDVSSSTDAYDMSQSTCACPTVFYSSSSAHLWNNCQ